MKDLRKLHRNSNIPKGMCIVISCHSFCQTCWFFTLLFCNIPKGMCIVISCHSFCQICWFLYCYFATIKIFCCEMSVRDRQAGKCTFLFAFRLLFISAKHDPESLFSYEILAGNKPLFSQ